MKQYGLCIDCYESITNPICVNCFIKQINHWLKDNRLNPETKKVLIYEIKKELNNINNREAETTCTVCHKNDVSICSYCFFLRVNKILTKLHMSKELKNQFLEIFNYRQGNEEY
jgi:hypothetical protein